MAERIDFSIQTLRRGRWTAALLRLQRRRLAPALRSVSRLLRGRDNLSGVLHFFWLWMRRPLRLGAVVPSGSALGSAMASRIDTLSPGTVVELGGGTGNITRAIRHAGVSSKDLVVVESEAALCQVIGSRFPGVRVWQADACDLETLVDRAGAPHVKTIVSSLPFLSMNDDVCHRILEAAFAVLPSDGEFVQFTYGVAEPIPERTLLALGIVGEPVERVLRNLPPATVWSYRRGEVQGARATRRRKNSNLVSIFSLKAGCEYVATWLRILLHHTMTWGESKLASKSDRPN